jgi:hypothetical protein
MRWKMEISTLAFTDKLGFDTIALASTRPLILLITGEDFRSVRDVQINGESAKRFELVSERQMLVEPAEGIGTSVNDVQIISSAPTATSIESNVGVTLDLFGTNVTGISALCQRFLHALLASQGSSYFEPDMGAGVRALAGTNVSGSFSSSDLSAAVEATLEYLLDDPNYGGLPESEQIVSADVVESSWDKSAQKLTLKIKLTNAEGDSLVTTAGA